MELKATNLKLLFKGAGSQIFLYGQPEQTIVLKMVMCNSKQSKHLVNQYTILKQLNHQYVISPLKFQRNIDIKNFQFGLKAGGQESTNFKQQNQNSVLSDILVLQHAQIGSLINIVRQKKLTVPQLRYLFYQLCEALQYLHCNYIVHRDLKLQNVLVFVQNSKLVCKLADFGFASCCYKQQNLILFNSFKGTKRGYMAPQIYQVLTNPQKFYDARKSDVFALGVLMFALFLGRLPFQYAKMQNNIYKFIVQGKIDQFWKQHQASLRKFQLQDFSMVQSFKQLFISMVRYNPNQRVTMQDVLDSEWINGLRQDTKA